MGAYGELFGGHKLRNDRDENLAGQGHDPGGPLDLDGGVVYLAPPSTESDQGPAPDGDRPDDLTDERSDRDEL